MNEIRASDFFSAVVARRWQFVDRASAWTAFLCYLDDRRGADLRTVFAQEQIAIAHECVDAMERGEEQSVHTEWFAAFDARPDVVKAATEFLVWRGLGAVVDEVVARQHANFASR